MEETWAKGGYEMLEMRMSGIEEEEGARHETGDLITNSYLSLSIFKVGVKGFGKHVFPRLALWELETCPCSPLLSLSLR